MLGPVLGRMALDVMSKGFQMVLLAWLDGSRVVHFQGSSFKVLYDEHAEISKYFE